MDTQLDFFIDVLTNSIERVSSGIIAGQRMAILEREARFLINKYYNS